MQPAELNYTLNAIATALEGRGEEIGENLVTLDGYLKRLNPYVPGLTRDLGKLATVSDTYAGVLPELASTLRNTVKTGRTLEGRQQRLRTFLRSTTGLAGTTQRILSNNEDNLIRLGQVSQPTVDLLKTYSPEFPCLLQGLVGIAPRLGSAFRDYTLHINLTPVGNQGRPYGTADLPVYGAKNPPYCGTLPNSPFDGTTFKRDIPNFDDGTGDNNSLRSTTTTGALTPRTVTGFDSEPSITVGGNAQEKAVIRSLAAPVLGTSGDKVGDVTTLLFGPLARGSEVSYR